MTRTIFAPTLAPSGSSTGATSVQTPQALAIMKASRPTMMKVIIGNIVPDIIGLHTSTKNSVICISLAIFWKVSAAISRMMIGSISEKPFTKVSQNSEKVMIFPAMYITMQTRMAMTAATTRSPVATAMPTRIASGRMKYRTLLPSSSPYSDARLYFLLASL